MANLTFADSHNMVAYLEKSAEKVDFAEIVDFLNVNPIRTQSMAIPNEHIPQRTSSGGSPKCQDTILGDRPAQTRFERFSKQSHEPSLSRVNTFGSRDDNMQLMELMKLCTKLSDRVLALENNKTAQDLEITHLKKRVTRLEKKSYINITTAEPVTTVCAPITTTGVSVSAAEPSTPPPTTTTIIEDEDLTIAQTLIKIKSEKSKEKAKERGSKENSTETATRPAKGVIMREAKKPLKKKNQIEFDEEVARNLKAQLQAELEEEEMLARQKEEEANIALIDEWDDVQAMMDADHELAKRLQAEEQGELTIEERKIVADDEVEIDVIPLATIPLIIVDWKIIKEGKISSYHIIRADGSLKRPEEAYERVLWGDLKVTSELDIESEVWRELQGNKVEKRYPLTPATITQMLNRKLQADHWNEMCYQLLKLMLKQLKKK
uniref:Uncharacterized protein n=1 Tax=Tanacetum cinerariifolium TaxID=118510 RepID=A0A6L2KQE5_TANCI|nr:hypothetical protein [Tanacetum cinerariifolium]